MSGAKRLAYKGTNGQATNADLKKFGIGKYK
jgi:hypothetical protein